ncbi:protein of unknown function DUF6, transmembrane [Alkaliphilus metalliredigens QYMF]|uniref:EamA domain-containing protein n=1 Tax=Alkaliphilus metalliredigens (strain QYMF) TaxID=293826 RepID=A6TMI6_ALKMQ|nr:DMT family transporter [Alkaliphilus metalliredigens]ABR47404.1 protein of unknown function DUF6, transmembrane [Alkaliphilus metalliredigens QYMF]
MQINDRTKGYLLIALASILWGTMGLVGKLLFSYELRPQDITFWKLLIGFIMMFVYLYIKKIDSIKIDRCGMWQLALVGLFCQALYNLFIFSAIEKTTIATATILLYTAPIFVTIMARIFYKERLTSYKVVALLFCILGCYLTITGGSLGAIKLDTEGMMLGLGAGFTYALTTITSRALLKRYSQWTILLYIFGFGALFSLLFANPTTVFQFGFNLNIWLGLFILGLVPTTLAYGLYITGLSYEVESSKAGIITTLEVVVAVLASYVFLGEVILGWKLIGVIMVLCSVIIVQSDQYLTGKIEAIKAKSIASKTSM